MRPDPLPQRPAQEPAGPSMPSVTGSPDRLAARGQPGPVTAQVSTPDGPVTSPDQHRPGHRRLDYIGALACAALLLLLLLADHPNGIEAAWVAGCSAALLIAVAVDRRLRRRGLRS
jgi:hypothetical protein